MLMLSELDAVNAMLRVIGSSPVTRLDDSGVVDAITARQCLQDASREVQARGWHFNTDLNVRLVPEPPLPGVVRLPPNCLQADTADSHDLDIIARGSCLYDRRNHTKRFSKTLVVHMVLCLPWDDLPAYARAYICARASRQYQMAVVGSETLNASLVHDEQRTLIALKTAEARNADWNILADSSFIRRLRGNKSTWVF